LRPKKINKALVLQEAVLKFVLYWTVVLRETNISIICYSRYTVTIKVAYIIKKLSIKYIYNYIFSTPCVT